MKRWLTTVLVTGLVWGSALAEGAGQQRPDSPAGGDAAAVRKLSGVTGGLVVHVGCRAGQLTAELGGKGWLVHGLDTDAGAVAAARKYLRGRKLYGPISVDQLRGSRLPYADNTVNLLVVVAKDLAVSGVTMAEIMRVLAPGGVVVRKSGGGWTKGVKPRPAQIDDWTHYLYDASNNAVSKDAVVAPPRRMQWQGGPRYARHHDRLSSVNAVVTAGGRVFTIFDETTPQSILIPSKWALIARDAFNGTVLWKRPLGEWFTNLWPLKSGPAQLPRRLVTDGKRVYVTLALDAPLTALDAATGQTVRTYENTRATEEAIVRDGVLFLLVNDAEDKGDYHGWQRWRRGYNTKYWDEAKRKVVAIQAETGKELWRVESAVLPGTLAADGTHVVFHNGESVVCLDRTTGKQVWRSEPIARAKEIRSFYLPILVLYEDVVLFSGGETAGLQTGSWYTKGEDTVTALSAKDGRLLWKGYHPPSGYRSPEDMLIAGGLLWTGETTSGRAVGVFTGRDPKTGKEKVRFEPDVKTYWFHHRCYRGKATENYLLMSRTGTEFLDFRKKTWSINHWVRGACLYGVMPANGLLYAPQHPCACYLESKQYGFNALAPAGGSPLPEPAPGDRLTKGPAYGEAVEAKPSPDDWSTYRCDGARSGLARTAVKAEIAPAWQARLRGKLSSLVVAEGKVFVAEIDRHTVCALDASEGTEAWRFTAGGRVDSPPTLWQGRVLFGSADGFVYCLRATDGALIWRFQAARADRRVVAFGQLESVWPVHGTVLVRETEKDKSAIAYVVAGRSMFLDGGLRLYRLDAATGRLLSRTVLDDRDRDAKKNVADYISWLNMPVAMPDVLTCDGTYVYMKSQPFTLDGQRLPLKPMPAGPNADAGAPDPVQDPQYTHLFCPTGLLDDTWWHRTYWMHGSMFVSGWCGYYRAGKTAPAGRILVSDDQKVYGFGRKPKYYRWTTQIEHQLFSADRIQADPDRRAAPAKPQPKETRVEVAKSKSLNLAGKPVTVEAWVHADKGGGVVLARGGGAMGYVLYLDRGRPAFAARSKGGMQAAVGTQRVTGRWVHLAGVLTADKVRLYVGGTLAAQAKSPGLLAGDPAEALQIGEDSDSSVGPYSGPFGLAGRIDEVRVYARVLSPEELAARAAGKGLVGKDEALVLAMSFDKGKATDASGKGNHGTVIGAKAVDGKVGQALQFTGSAKRAPKDYLVRQNWTTDLPLLARAMVLAPRAGADGAKTLFIAGPPDLVDEEDALRRITDPDVQKALLAQDRALTGEQGMLLWAVDAGTGERLAETKLPGMVVFDGLIAAGGKLYLATTDGRVICLGGAK